MDRIWRSLILMGLDTMAAVLAILIAFVVRFALDGRTIPPQYLEAYLRVLPILLPVGLIIYLMGGLYEHMWAHAGVRELLRVVGAVTLDSLAFSVIIFTLPNQGFPRSVIFIGWFLKIAFLGSVRLALRLRKERFWTRQKTGPRQGNRILIFGAGDAGALLAREYAKHPEIGAEVVGFVDDDLRKQGLRIGGKLVFGNRDRLQEIVQAHKIDELVIAMPSVPGFQIREVVEAGRRLGLQVRTLPGLYELANGAVSVNQIRNVQIEDLLGRSEIQLDLAAIAGYLTGETVLVTGAGGSIGSELCRQVARFAPGRMILLGHGENSIYEIDQELSGQFPSLEIRPVIADIQDELRIRQVFEQFRPSVVFHAAAHKHVPLMEYNPEEAVKNNVLGTLNVARAADFYKAKRFVLISSDKAVNPTSVMGATKRGAEIVIQSMASSSKTVFVAVRFGNVLGSRGSVIPVFKRQIAAGGPVTITDPRMVRYFMTIPEAVQLVIQAASMGTGGEVFVLDMGKPVRIVDLARDLIRLSGLEPDRDIEIKFSGVRPGEKLYEDLLTAEEGTLATMHHRIYVARGEGLDANSLTWFLQTVREALEKGGVTNEWLRALVAEATESESGRHVAAGQM